ncbi:MAG: hypothetical protein EXR51_11430 [Dehalococcoidia bacterium]|nr:hypothetical protein [Dehalococcoidia bacterium]
MTDTAFALDDGDFNPLTLRMVAALKATNRLSRLLERQPVASARKTDGPTDNDDPVPEMVWMGDRPLLMSAEPGSGRSADFPITEAQASLFHYFHACTGALDRTAADVCLLLEGGERRLGWRAVVRPRMHRKWQDRFPALSAWLSGPTAAPLLRAFDYLAWFEEAGFVPSSAELVDEGRRWRLWIPEAGPPAGAALAVDALQLCRVLQRDACTVFNGVYHMLHQQVQEQGLPPW